MTIEIKKGEIYEYRGNRGSWGDLPSVVGTLGMITHAEEYEIKCSCIRNNNGFVDTMVRDGTFVKVAEADGTPVEPVKEPEAPEDWVEKERVRLGIPEIKPATGSGEDMFRMDTHGDSDYLYMEMGEGELPASVYLSSAHLHMREIKKLVVVLLHLREVLKKAGYDV